MWHLYCKGRPLGLPVSVGTCRPEKTIAGRRSAGNETANIIAIPALGPPLPFRGEPSTTSWRAILAPRRMPPRHRLSTGLQPLPGFRWATFSRTSPTHPRTPACELRFPKKMLRSQVVNRKIASRTSRGDSAQRGSVSRNGAPQAGRRKGRWAAGRSVPLPEPFPSPPISPPCSLRRAPPFRGEVFKTFLSRRRVLKRIAILGMIAEIIIKISTYTFCY